jgi:hypothetical protein
MEHYHDDWYRRFWPPPPPPVYPQIVPVVPVVPMPTPQEIEEFRKLLERARQYDKEHNQPDCELEEKRQKIKKLAEELGIKVDFV